MNGPRDATLDHQPGFACWLVLLALGFIWSPMTAFAAPTAEQKGEIARANSLLAQAASLFKEKKFDEAGKKLDSASELVGKLAKEPSPELLRSLKPIHAKINKALGLLELEGVAIQPLAPLPDLDGADKKTAKPSKKTEKLEKDGVSFTKEIAPILVAKCGRCHVTAQRGMFSMASYEVLMRGHPQAGKVVFPGDPNGSRVIEVIVSKDMPRGGAPVSDDELEKLKQWITQGAKFDGADATASLQTLGGVEAPKEAPKDAMASQATGKETVSFTKDIAPVLVANCIGCHSRQPSANLNLSTITTLLRGGTSGATTSPGKPTESLLVQKLKGTAGGQRMPLGRPPLPDETIEKFVTWITEGVKFDSTRLDQPLGELVAMAEATAASHAELSAKREALAVANWKLGMPETPFEKSETKNFLVIGNVGKATLEELGAQAETLVPKVAKALGASTEAPLLKGRITLFAFRDRYDYSEFGKMVEKRDIPLDWRSHSKYSVVDAYLAVVKPKGGDSTGLQASLAQQIGALYTASIGNGAPRWFVEGAGRYVASRVASSDPTIKKWNADLEEHVAGLKTTSDFMAENYDSEGAASLGFGFVRAISADRTRFDKLLKSLRSGEEFSKAFSKSYGVDCGQLAQTWGSKAFGIRPGKARY